MSSWVTLAGRLPERVRANDGERKHALLFMPFLPRSVRNLSKTLKLKRFHSQTIYLLKKV